MARRWQAVLARLGTPTGDGRIISPGGLTSRDLPLPLLWQQTTGDGHGGAQVVGRIETVDFGQDMVTATGSLLDDGEWSGVVELIENGVIGPSVDLDDLNYVANDDTGQVVITSARIAGATLVAIPAFADVSITLAPRPAPDVVSRETSPEPMYDYDELYASVTVDVSRETSLPPLEYFTRPAEVGPLKVEGDKVSGYIATWGSCHVGLPGCTTAPPSSTNYAHFLRKEQLTADGTSVPVGVLSVGGGHAAPDTGAVPALEHYDNVAASVAKVFAGEDENGIWVSGWILPYADPVRVQQLADLDVSGDWRRIGGRMELIAVCAVNTPGFPVLRKVHFSLGKGGQQTLIGQFKVEPQAHVSRETVNDHDARAAWARAQWKGQS